MKEIYFYKISVFNCYLQVAKQFYKLFKNCIMKNYIFHSTYIIITSSLLFYTNFRCKAYNYVASIRLHFLPSVKYQMSYNIIPLQNFQTTHNNTIHNNSIFRNEYCLLVFNNFLEFSNSLRKNHKKIKT